MDTTLIVPGLERAAPDHLAVAGSPSPIFPSCIRVVQSDWTNAGPAAVVGTAAPRAEPRVGPCVRIVSGP